MKCSEGKDFSLNLDQNIRCGNSLIDSEFDWQKEFSQIFKLGGFDIVIGNPPYLKMEYFTEKQKEDYYRAFGFHNDLYVYFIFTGYNLVKNGGTLCFIANDSFLGFKNTKNIRSLFFDNDLR